MKVSNRERKKMKHKNGRTLAADDCEAGDEVALEAELDEVL